MKRKSSFKKYLTISLLATLLLFILMHKEEIFDLTSSKAVNFFSDNLSQFELELSSMNIVLNKFSPDAYSQVDFIWRHISDYSEFEVKKTKYAVENRAAAAVVQILMEKILAENLSQGKINNLKIYLLTPGAPAPFRSAELSNIRSVKIEDYDDLIALRREYLINLLELNVKISSIYSDRAPSMPPFNFGQSNYIELLQEYEVLRDFPIINIDPFKFPKESTAAIYIINNNPKDLIILSSFQLKQGEAGRWSFSVGEVAYEKLKAFDLFLLKSSIKPFSIIEDCKVN